MIKVPQKLPMEIAMYREIELNVRIRFNNTVGYLSNDPED